MPGWQLGWRPGCFERRVLAVAMREEVATGSVTPSTACLNVIIAMAWSLRQLRRATA